MSDETDFSATSDLPSVSEILRDISGIAPEVEIKSEEEFENDFRTMSARGERAYVHLRGLEDHYRHKKYWSWFIMFLMFCMVAFQSYLLYMVGETKWSFHEYDWLLPALLVQNLAQIVGLAIFVVKALFRDMGDK